MSKTTKILVLALFCVSSLIGSSSFSQTFIAKYTDNFAEINKFNNNCQKIRPYLNVQLGKPGDVKIDHSWLAEKITSYDASLKVMAPQSITWGITEAVYAFDVNYKIETVESNSLGVVCAVPGIDMTIGFKEIDIKMARELVPGSCAYNYVLNHEREHVEIYKKNIDIMRQNLFKAIEKKLNGKIFVGENKDMLLFQAGDFIQSFLNDEIKIESEKIRAVQNKFDSPEEYKKAEGVCDGVLTKVVSK